MYRTRTVGFGHIRTLAVLFCVFADLNFVNTLGMTGPTHGKVVVCYVGTWSVYRPGRGAFAIENIDPTLCTHLIYSFAGLNVTEDSMRSLDPWQDLTDDYGKGGFNRMTSLRGRYPHLKVSLAIGGWNEGSKNYSQMANSATRRSRFVANALAFIRKYNFDGLDLDWEFPGKRGGESYDKQNFVLLVKELRAAFRKHGLLLTAALGAGKDTIDIAYDVPALNVYLDYFHMMCYDYHGTWDLKTGANAPLKSTRDTLSVEYTIEYMLKLGASPEKLVVGLPFYGRTFVLDQSSLEGSKPQLGINAKSVGFQGPFTRENGFMGYNEICVQLQNSTYGWQVHFDEESRTPFAVSEDKVIAYDDERSIAEKVDFTIRKRLAGSMVWSLDTDDFLGDCAKGSKGSTNFPLLRSINRAIEDTLREIEREKDNVIPHGETSGGNSQEAPTILFLAAIFIAGSLANM